MVLLHVKQDNQSLFLLDSKVSDSVSSALENISRIQNGRLKVLRICGEVECLSNHGVSIPPEMQGLLEEQVVELKLKDEEGERCLPSGGFDLNPDPVQRRNGRAPKAEMKQVLDRTAAEAKLKISADNVKANVCLNWSKVKECLDILKGAVTIVYPMGLPMYDPIQMEFENREEIEEKSQAQKSLVDISEATLWFANKEMKPTDPLSVYTGSNEKTKVVVKLSTNRKGQPVTESWMSPDTQRRLAMENFKRAEELRRLETDRDDSYMDSTWADGQQLKRRFQGMNNISWKP